MPYYESQPSKVLVVFQSKNIWEINITCPHTYETKQLWLSWWHLISQASFKTGLPLFNILKPHLVYAKLFIQRKCYQLVISSECFFGFFFLVPSVKPGTQHRFYNLILTGTARSPYCSHKKTEVQSNELVQGHTAYKMEVLRLDSVTVPLQCWGSYKHSNLIRNFWRLN